MDNGDTRGDTSVAIMAVFTTVATTIVGLRLYTRFWMIRNPGPEDYFISVAVLCDIALLIGSGFEARYGMGQHVDKIPGENMEKLQFSLWMTIHFYSLTLAFVKISIVLQFLRIFTGGVIRRVCWVTLGAMIIYLFWSFFSVVFSCYPVAKFWNPTLEGTCEQQTRFWYSNPLLNLLTDVWLLILPIPVIRQLQLPKKQKLGLVVIFALGGIVTLISILRFPYLARFFTSQDPTYDNAPIAIYSVVESSVAIVTASVPALKPLAVRIFPRLLSSTGNPSHTGAASAIFSARVGRRSTRLGSNANHGQDGNRDGKSDYGVRSDAWREYPMERLGSDAAPMDDKAVAPDESEGWANLSGIRVTTVVAQTVSSGKEDVASVAESETKLVGKV